MSGNPTPSSNKKPPRGMASRVVMISFAVAFVVVCALVFMAWLVHGGAHVRAFAVINVFHTIQNADGFHAVRLAPVFAQAVEHGRQRAAARLRQGQRGQRVQRVVAVADAQRIRRHRRACS